MNTAAKITAIKQEKASSLAATFSADVTGIKDTDIKIVRDETKAVVTVKKVTVDAKDNTKATIETYEALTDGKTYTVTYTAADEAKTQSSANFTATTGEVKDLALNTYTVPANTLTEIKYQTLDANGVIIAEAGIGSAAANNMEITVENANGYQKDNEILLNKTGDTATVKVVYHTYKYNNTDSTEVGKVDRTFTITAVDQSTVIKTFDYTVADVTKKNSIDFKRDTLVHQLAVEDDIVTDPYVFFSFRTAADKNITTSLDYSVTSGNENVLLASGTVAGGAKLTPVGVGATYLVIKDASGKIVTTLPINVVAKRSLASTTVDKSTVTIAENATVAGDQKITVAVMDQYSANYSKYNVANPVLRSNNNPGNLSVTSSKGNGNNAHKITITVSAASGAKTGTYNYTMDISDDANDNNVKRISFTVVVSTVLNGQTTYALVMMNSGSVVSKVDTTVTATGSTYSPITLKPTIVTKNNGSITGVAGTEIVKISALKLTYKGAEVKNTTGIYYNKADYTNNDGGVISEAAIKVSENTGSADSSAVKKNLEAGTYTVSFKASIDTNGDRTIDRVQDMSTSFVVEDSQKSFEVSVKKDQIPVGLTTLSQVFEDTTLTSFAYAGDDLDKTQYDYKYVSADATKTNANGIRVNKVTMAVKLPGTNGKYVQMTAVVNRTLYFGSDISTPDVVKAAIIKFNNDYVNGAALKVPTTTNSAIINDYVSIENKYNSLTSAEQTTALTASLGAIKARAKEVAQNILLGVKNTSYNTDKLNTNVFTVLGVKNAASSDYTMYGTLLSKNSSISAASDVTTANIQAVVSDAAIFNGITVATRAGITTGVAIKSAKTGATIQTTGFATDIDSATDIGTTERVHYIEADTADGTITIVANDYKVVYTVSPIGSGDKTVKTITAVYSTK